MKRVTLLSYPLFSVVKGGGGNTSKGKSKRGWVNSSLVTDPKTEIFLLFPINYLRFTIYYFFENRYTDTYVFCMYLFIVDSKHYLLINNSFINSFTH